MPTYWMVAEGPPAFGIGLVIVLLNPRVQQDAATEAPGNARDDPRACEK